MDTTLNPEISVILPVYNCRQYIEESVFSIINQTFTDFECIIIDDCSTDGTFEYLQTLTDKRIRLIRKTQNTGYTVSLNMGLEMTTGKYIARMDGDDISLTDRFEKQVAFMEINPDVVVCGGGYIAIGSDFKFIPKTSFEDIISDLISVSPFAHPTVFIRNSILKINNIQYDPDYEPAEDYKLWTVLSEYGKLANLSDVLLRYRIHENQTSSLRGKTQLEIGKKISSEFIKNISNGNVDSDLFSNPVLNTYKNYKRYEDVETDLKTVLKKRGIVISDKFFADRKRHYLKKGLTQDGYSIPRAIKTIRLFFVNINLLGSSFVFKYILKSLVFWKASNEMSNQE
jgi:glycosyltransferase involved in cell wall biosynthesis